MAQNDDQNQNDSEGYQDQNEEEALDSRSGSSDSEQQSDITPAANTELAEDDLEDLDDMDDDDRDDDQREAGSPDRRRSIN